MGANSLLNELRKVTELKNNWYSVARVCEKIKQTAEHGQLSRRIRDAAEVSGFSVNTLNRMLSVKYFLDLVGDKIPQLRGIDPNRLSFPSLEVVKRLHQVDPEEGSKQLLLVVKGETTYRELRAKYDAKMHEAGGYSAGQAARMATRRFESIAIDYIKSMYIALGVNMRQIRVHSDAELVHVIVETQSKTSAPILEGILIETLMRPGKDKLRQFLLKSLVYGDFFDRYWIAFPSDGDSRSIEVYLRILDLLGKASYGVILIPVEESKDNAKVVRKASGVPFPDLRGKLHVFQELQKSFLQEEP